MAAAPDAFPQSHKFALNGVASQVEAPEARDGDGFSPLMCAALHGHTKLVRKLLKAGGEAAGVEVRDARSVGRSI
jgi:ankyrin repeat protein